MSDDFPILAAIATSPTNPHQVLDHLQAAGLKAARSTLYRRIDALIENGLVDATEASGAQPRRLSLSPRGRDYLATEAAAVLGREPLESPRFALAVMCADLAGGEELSDTLRQRMAETARRLTTEERTLNAIASRDEYWSIAGRERRIAHLQADVAWLQSVMGRRTVPRTGAPPQPARERTL